MIPVNETFITKDIARQIVDETNQKFDQTLANISSFFSPFKKTEYPAWLEVVGKQGRSRLYRKKKDVSSREIEVDLGKAA